MTSNSSANVTGSSPLSSTAVHPVAWAPLLIIVVARVLLHFVSNIWLDYGMFRDEYYYLACADHIAWGYVDHPPLSIFLLAIQTGIFGDSVFALRILPTLAGAGMVLLTGLLARELGANRAGQVLAALVAAFTHTFLAFSSFYSMNAFDLFFWAAILYTYVRISKHAIPTPGFGESFRPWRRYGMLWTFLGVLLGLAMLNKLSVVWLGAGLALGIILTRQRRWLLTPWPWIAALIAFMLFAPHVVWQLQHGRPTIAFIHNATALKHATFSPASFTAGVLMYMNPLLLPVWAGGLLWLIVGRRSAPNRWLAWTIAFVIVYLTFSGDAKPYYPVLAFPALAAAAGGAYEEWLKHRKQWLRRTVFGYVVIVIIPFLPFGQPLIPPGKLVAWSNLTGITLPIGHRGEAGELPQHLSGCFGWHELAETVEEVYRQLPETGRQQARVITKNYAQAASLQHLSSEYELPQVYSGHNNFWFWGPPDSFEGSTIAVGLREEKLRTLFQHVELSAEKNCEFCSPSEDDLPIFVCNTPLLPLDELWRELRIFI